MEKSDLKQENTQNKIKSSPEKKKTHSCSCFFTLFDILSSFVRSRSNRNHQIHINPEPNSPPSIITNRTDPAPIEHFTVSPSPAPISPCISYSPRTLDRLLCSRFSASDHLSYSPSSLNVPPTEAPPNRDEATKPVTRACGSLAVAKWSSDREGDFRDSMKEMINENGIRRYEDLQDLLTRYLSLNVEEHHGAIVNVFRQVSVELMNNDPCIEVSSF